MVEVVLVAMKAKRVDIDITPNKIFAVVSNTYLDYMHRRHYPARASRCGIAVLRYEE